MDIGRSCWVGGFVDSIFKRGLTQSANSFCLFPFLSEIELFPGAVLAILWMWWDPEVRRHVLRIMENKEAGTLTTSWSHYISQGMASSLLFIFFFYTWEQLLGLFHGWNIISNRDFSYLRSSWDMGRSLPTLSHKIMEVFNLD